MGAAQFRYHYIISQNRPKTKQNPQPNRGHKKSQKAAVFCAFLFLFVPFLSLFVPFVTFCSLFDPVFRRKMRVPPRHEDVKLLSYKKLQHFLPPSQFCFAKLIAGVFAWFDCAHHWALRRYLFILTHSYSCICEMNKLPKLTSVSVSDFAEARVYKYALI